MAALSQSKKTLINKARTLGSGNDRVYLDTACCCYLAAVIISDLGLETEFPEFTFPVDAFFEADESALLDKKGVDLMTILERLFRLNDDADTYFSCLASLHKRRVRYQRILRQQAIPTMEQVGPRGLLQFGSLSPRALASLLYWRKWIYDTDNRAAQQTGYLFEPIIASSIGGSPYSEKRSPIRRSTNKNKGRQVDCILDNTAYEFKIRITIAASGQGRWGEELQFPADCKASGYKPILVVLDPTENDKLTALQDAFAAVGGESYVGEDAWKHLDSQAGDTMTMFLEKYVRGPIDDLLKNAPSELPDITFRQRTDEIEICIGKEKHVIPRESQNEYDDDDVLPDDVDEELPGLD